MRHHSNRFILVVATACSIGAHAARAQVTPGQQLRILQGAHTLTEGVYLGPDSDGYAILLAGTDTVRIPMDGSYKAEWFARRQSRGIGAFGKGLAIGAIPGVVFAALSALPHEHHSEEVVGNLLVAFASAVFLVSSGVVGAVRATLHHDIWIPVTLTPAGAAGSSGVVPRQPEVAHAAISGEQP